MKILHINTTDGRGGAARAAVRLHEALREFGVDSKMMVQKKTTSQAEVYESNRNRFQFNSYVSSRLDKIPTLLYTQRDPGPFSPSWIPGSLKKGIDQHAPDVVHLHWVCGGFFRPEEIQKIDQPIVWTIHDMWPFTGGCHYSKSCEKYKSTCGECPHLDSGSQSDLANSIFQRKAESWKDSDFAIVSPSEWLAEEAKASSLLGNQRILTIPNCVDLQSYRPRNRNVGLDEFNLDPNNVYILYGASYTTPRKGGDLFLKSLELLDEDLSVEILTFGSNDVQDGSFSFAVHEFGVIPDRMLQLLFSTADLCVVPSREDNLPNIAMESLASGTPVLAFNTGGLPDLVEHKTNGYLSKPFDEGSLAKGIQWIVSSVANGTDISSRAREKAESQYGHSKIAADYNKLYTSLIG